MGLLSATRRAYSRLASACSGSCGDARGAGERSVEATPVHMRMPRPQRSARTLRDGCAHLQRVAVDEDALFVGVRVQVEVELELPLLHVVHQLALDGPHARLQLLRSARRRGWRRQVAHTPPRGLCRRTACPRSCQGGQARASGRPQAHPVWVAQVVAVEVLPQGVGPVKAVVHAVGVDHGHQLEHKEPAQRGGARVVLPQQKGQRAVEHVRGGRLAGVHARRDEEHLHGGGAASGRGSGRTPRAQPTGTAPHGS